MSVTGFASAVAQNSDGRLQLVWVDGTQARMKYELDLAGNYSAEADLGPHGYQVIDSKPMVMARNDQGRLVVFAFAVLGGARVAISQVAPNGAWGAWSLFP